MSNPVHIPLTRQWRVTVGDDEVPHLEIEVDHKWSRDFVAERFPKSFAAELILTAWRRGWEEAEGKEAML